MMNYLRYISIFMGLFFVSLICISSSFAISPVNLEFSDLSSNLTISVNDSVNIKSNLKNLNSLDNYDLNESILKSNEYKVSNNNISINNCSLDSNYSSNINSVNAISGNTFTDIQNAINNAKNGDNIVLNNIIYSGKGSFISVNKSVNIIGNGAILDGKGSSVIMKVSSPNVNLTNIHFINGYSEKYFDSGALILDENANKCKVSDCLFKNNSGTQGTVYVYSDYTKFLNCNFTDNIGIANRNKTIYKNTSIMSGGLNVENNASYAYVSGCIFKGNIGRAGGGASLRGDYNTIENSIFIYNQVNEGFSERSYAGALHVGPNNGSKSSASVLNCVFINNVVNNKLHRGHAGALCFEDGSIMDNCTFINNYCEGVGGATTLHGSGIISNCVFINCTATVCGGAISTGYNEEVAKWSANFTDCYFEGNAAPIGGAVCAIGDGIKFSNSSFLDNIAVSGGAIYVQGNNALFDNLSVINNSADLGGAFYIEGSSTIITNNLLEGNNANVGGGVVIIGNNSNLNNLNISQNIAKYGGGVYINGSNTLVSQVVFNSNQAIPLKDTPYNDSHMGDGIGGGAFINGINITIENTVFSFNSARNGSGVYLSGSQMKFNNVSTLGANKAWSYLIPLSYSLNPNSTISFNITHYGGNNINGGNQSTNYIYLNAPNDELVMDGLIPVDTVENSDNGIKLFKDNREQYQNINVNIYDKDGEIAKTSGLTDLYGFYSGEFDISNLNHNILYVLSVTHEDDTFYTYINNISYFTISEPWINKTVDKEVVFKDEIINYNLTIKNIAPLEANFLVTDILPEYFVYQGTNLTPIYEYDSKNHKIIWNIIIPAESACVINIWGYSNKTNINLTNFMEVYNPIANISNKVNNTVLVLPEANLNITVAPNKDEVNKGENLTWIINVTNNGPNSAFDLVITDLFDSNLMEFISCNDSHFNQNSGELLLDSLDANESFSFNIVVNIIKSNTTVKDLANVYSPTNNSNHYPNNCSDTGIAQVLPQANLVLNVSANNHEVNLDDIICWTVNLTNLGPDTAIDVVILDLLDLDNLEYVSCNDSRFDIDSNKLDVGDMAPEDSILFEVYTKVIKSGVIIRDLVNAYSPTNNRDFVANNVSANDSVKSKAIINIQVNKSSNLEIVTVGDEVIWTITVINEGLNTAHDVYAIDKIPHNLEFISANTNVGTYDSLSGVWLIGDLDSNVTCTLTIVTISIESGNVTNIVSVYCNDSDYDGNVSIANATIEVTDPIYRDIDYVDFDNDVDDNVDESKNDNKNYYKKIPMENSGNPLSLIIFSLLIFTSFIFRRKF